MEHAIKTDKNFTIRTQEEEDLFRNPPPTPPNELDGQESKQP